MEEYQEPIGISDFAGYVIIVILTILVLCVLANTIASLIDRVSPDLRTISSGQAWISIIPVVGSFWIFYVVYHTSNMVHEEYQRRKIVEFENSPGLVSGWGFSFILFCAQLTLLMDATIFSVALYLGAIATLVVYWLKLTGYKTKLDADLMRHHTQQFSQTYAPPATLFPPPSFPPPVNTPPPPTPPVDEWERWKPR